MNNSSILQYIETNKSALTKMMDVSVTPEEGIITIRKRSGYRTILIILAYTLIFISLVFLWVGSSLGYWGVVAVCPFVVLYCIWGIREQARTIIVDMSHRIISVKGRFQKERSFSWNDYQGHEIYCSVKDFPEEFFIKFMDGGKVKKIKLADINPVFHKSTETNYTILLGLWECIKANM